MVVAVVAVVVGAVIVVALTVPFDDDASFVEAVVVSVGAAAGVEDVVIVVVLVVIVVSRVFAVEVVVGSLVLVGIVAEGAPVVGGVGVFSFSFLLAFACAMDDENVLAAPVKVFAVAVDGGAIATEGTTSLSGVEDAACSTERVALPPSPPPTPPPPPVAATGSSVERVAGVVDVTVGSGAPIGAAIVEGAVSTPAGVGVERIVLCKSTFLAAGTVAGAVVAETVPAVIDVACVVVVVGGFCVLGVGVGVVVVIVATVSASVEGSLKSFVVSIGEKK